MTLTQRQRPNLEKLQNILIFVCGSVIQNTNFTHIISLIANKKHESKHIAWPIGNNGLGQSPALSLSSLLRFNMFFPFISDVTLWHTPQRLLTAASYVENSFRRPHTSNHTWSLILGRSHFNAINVASALHIALMLLAMPSSTQVNIVKLALRSW